MNIGSRLFRFVVVGGLAALTHLCVASLLIHFNYFHPLIANVFGFLVAFVVSYSGQAGWTFVDRTAVAPKSLQSRVQSWGRFFIVALFGFGLNEAVFYVGLSLGYHYIVALLMAIVVAAVSGYAFNSLWVFKKSVSHES